MIKWLLLGWLIGNIDMFVLLLYLANKIKSCSNCNQSICFKRDIQGYRVCDNWERRNKR